MQPIPPLAMALFWRAAKSQLDAAKKREAFWRKRIGETLFSDANIGTNRVAITNEEDLRFIKKENVTFKYDEAKFLKLWASFTPQQVEWISTGGVFKNDVVFSATAYRALPDDVRKMIDASGLVEIKDAAPVLDIAGRKEMDIA